MIDTNRLRFLAACFLERPNHDLPVALRASADEIDRQSDEIAELTKRLDAMKKERDEARRWAGKLLKDRDEWKQALINLAEIHNQLYEAYKREKWLSEQWEKNSEEVAQLCDNKTQVIMGLKNQLFRWVERARRAEGGLRITLDQEAVDILGSMKE